MSRTIIFDPIEPISDRQPGYGAYEIDIEDVLRQSLPGKFDEIEPASLDIAHIETLPLFAKGAYLLFHDRTMVYAGKTDTRHGFRDRLKRHSESVQHRVGLDPRQMAFKAMRIMVFSAFDVEAILISEMRNRDRNALKWNDSGFGSNDPGRRRDDGEPAAFDRDFPINVDLPLPVIPSGPTTVSELLTAAKGAVPYLLRYGALDGFENRIVLVPDRPVAIRDIISLVANALTSDFQITIFHGRIILYKEMRRYDFAREVLRGTA